MASPSFGRRPACWIGNIAGPYMNKIQSYALGDMLNQARKNGRIRIAAAFPVFRSYLHVLDLADLVLAALTAGVGGSGPVDLCGAEVLEMGDIAYRVAKLTGLSAGSITRPAIKWLQSNLYLGNFADTKVLAMRLGLSLAEFDRQLVDTDDDLLARS